MSLLNDERADKLIVETETGPALYNKNLKGYSDIGLKGRCEPVFEDWTTPKHSLAVCKIWQQHFGCTWFIEAW
jgi:hypothetical protein